MSDMRVALKDDERWCGACDGYGGFPYNPNTPMTNKTIGRCHICEGSGKRKKYEGFVCNHGDDGDIWENWGRGNYNYYRGD